MQADIDASSCWEEQQHGCYKRVWSLWGLTDALYWTWTSGCRFSCMQNGILCISVHCHLSHQGTWMTLGRPIRLSRINTKKRCPFHHRVPEYKSRKSRDTWNNRQVWTWSTKWGRTKASRVLANRGKMEPVTDNFPGLQNHWGQWL